MDGGSPLQKAPTSPAAPTTPEPVSPDSRRNLEITLVVFVCIILGCVGLFIFWQNLKQSAEVLLPAATTSVNGSAVTQDLSRIQIQSDQILARALVGDEKTRGSGEGTSALHPSVSAYIVGSSTVASNTLWRAKVVMPESLVGHFGLPDISWGDGTSDDDTTGTLWKYDGSDIKGNTVDISHVYAKSGVYQVHVTIGGDAEEFIQGPVILNPVITVNSGTGVTMSTESKGVAGVPQVKTSPTGLVGNSAEGFSYPKYDIRELFERGSGTTTRLFGVDASGQEHQVDFILKVITRGGWTYYATYKPESDARSVLSYASNNVTKELNVLSAGAYQDSWHVDTKKLTPFGPLYLASAYNYSIDPKDTRTLYLVDVLRGNMEVIAKLPENETFVESFDGFGGMPNSYLTWSGVASINARIFDATKENDTPGGSKVHPLLRTQSFPILDRNYGSNL